MLLLSTMRSNYSVIFTLVQVFTKKILRVLFIVLSHL